MNKIIIWGPAITAMALCACEVTSQSPVATAEVDVATKDVRPVINQFAKDSGLAVGVTEREQQFGPSSTFELSDEEVLLVVANPFSPRKFLVSGYSEVERAKPRAQQLVRGIASRLSQPRPR